MKTRTWILYTFLGLALMIASGRAADNIDELLTKEISKILIECKALVPGVTRAELMKVFTTEGGLSTAKTRTFVHKRCPYIKVDVDFTLSDSEQSVVDERPTDVIRKISRPYLQWSVVD